MRWTTLAKTIAATILLGMAAVMPAAATDLHHTKAPHGWGRAQAVTHHVYYPRYRHVYLVHGYTDPYAYRPAYRGYYPYYNSGYWKPLAEMRHRAKPHYALPAYYPAWGYPKKNYHHKKWHYKHHGHHYPWHW